MSLPPFRRFNFSDIPEIENWIRDVSGIWDIRVVANKSGYPPELVNGSAAYVDYTKDGTHKHCIYLNPHLIFWKRQYILYYKAYLMHEAGHILNPRFKHGHGTEEFKAHLWAVKKASRTGMEKELACLRSMIKYWYLDYSWREKSNRKFHIAYRFFQRKSII